MGETKDGRITEEEERRAVALLKKVEAEMAVDEVLDEFRRVPRSRLARGRGWLLWLPYGIFALALFGLPLLYPGELDFYVWVFLMMLFFCEAQTLSALARVRRLAVALGDLEAWRRKAAREASLAE